MSGLFGTLVRTASRAEQPAALPATATPAEPSAPQPVGIVSSPALAEAPGLAPAASFWTDERIRSAKPYPLPEVSARAVLPPFISAAPDGAAGWAPALPPDGPEQDFIDGLAANLRSTPDDGTVFNPNSYALFPFRAIGRVYFMDGGKAYACSGAAIGEFAVWTAGHCLHPGNGDPNGWYTNWAFIPAYQDGARPYGTWSAAYLYATSQWISNGMNGGLQYDYGVAIVQPLNGQTIRQAVGALGFAWNQAVDLPRVAMGYPSDPQPPFYGQKQVITTASHAFNDPNMSPPPYPIGINSTMGHGASGGPWILNYSITANAGYNLLNGNNSYIYDTTPRQDIIYSPYFGDVSRTMYDCAAGSTPTHRTCGSEADLALRLSSSRSAVLPGELFTYTLVVDNWGALDANHLVLTDTVAPGTSIITASLSGGSCAWLNRNIFCLRPLLPRWTTITATLAVAAPPGNGPALNLAGARSDQNDYTPADNVGIPLIVIVGQPTYLPQILR